MAKAEGDGTTVVKIWCHDCHEFIAYLAQLGGGDTGPKWAIVTPAMLNEHRKKAGHA